MPDTQRPQPPSLNVPLVVFQIVLPVVVAAVIGYGAASRATGELTERSQNQQLQIDTNRQAIDQLKSIAISKDQFELLMKMIEDIKQNAKETRDEIREIRRDKK